MKELFLWFLMDARRLWCALVLLIVVLAVLYFTATSDLSEGIKTAATLLLVPATYLFICALSMMVAIGADYVRLESFRCMDAMQESFAGKYATELNALGELDSLCDECGKYH